MTNNKAINLRSMDLNLLPIFNALMQEQHLSHAASQLAMSQPAVSNALKRLRQSFNDDLFVRTAHGLKPTPRANEIQQHLQAALQQIQQAYSPALFDPQSSEKSLKITMNAATEYLLSPLLIGWLRKTAPNMQLQLYPDHLADIPQQLKSGQLDYALDYIPFDTVQFNHAILSHEPLAVIISKCSAAKNLTNSQLSLQQFEQLPQITLVARTSPNQGNQQLNGSPIEQLLGTAMPQRNIAMAVSSFVAIPNIVANSDLIAIVPERLAKKNQNSNELLCIPLPFECPPVAMYLQWHKSRDKDPVHQWFLKGMSKLLIEIF